MDNPHGDGPPALATIAIHKGPGAGDELPVKHPIVTIGKGSRSDILIDDDSVSTLHARIEHDRAGWRITDLGSANGTFLDSVRLAPEVPTPLASGAAVRFGGVETQFRPVPGSDPAAAREAYVPPSEPAVPIRGTGSMRFPLWVLLLLILLMAAIWFGLVWLPEPGPGPPPAPPADGPVSSLVEARAFGDPA
jgi:hypothetical protein